MSVLGFWKLYSLLRVLCYGIAHCLRCGMEPNMKIDDSKDFYPQEPLRISIAQTASKDGQVLANINVAVEIIYEAAQRDSDLVVFPEKFLTGYIPELIITDIESYTLIASDSRLEPIRKVCRENKIGAIIGAPIRNAQGIYISSIIFDKNGKDIGVYNKTHLFHSEKEIFASDNKLVILKIKDWNIGLGICYDSGFAEHSRLLAQYGAHVYVVSGLFSKGMGYLESRVWFPARALDNTMYVVMSNHIGETGIWNTCGSSGVWDPFGKLLVEASETNQEIITIELSAEALIKARKVEQMLADSYKIKYDPKKIMQIRVE